MQGFLSSSSSGPSCPPPSCLSGIGRTVLLLLLQCSYIKKRRRVAKQGGGRAKVTALLFLPSSCRKTPGETNPPRRRKYSNGEEGKAKHCTPSSVLYSAVVPTKTNPSSFLPPSSFLLPPSFVPWGLSSPSTSYFERTSPSNFVCTRRKRAWQSETFLFPGKNWK